jgi:hypothetical protein
MQNSCSLKNFLINRLLIYEYCDSLLIKEFYFMMNNSCGGMEQVMETDEYKNSIFFDLINHRN